MVAPPPAAPVDALAPWSNFFVLAGTAGVTLLGLVFVAVSLNSATIMRERHLKVQAEVAFEALVFTSIISLLGLAQLESRRMHGTMFAAFGAVWLIRAIAHVRRFGRPARTLRRRLLMPIAAYVAVAVAGLQLARSTPDVGLLLLAAVIWLVATATRNAWSLLVDVGDVRGGVDSRGQTGG